MEAIDHDRLFKEVLTHCFGDFLALFTPELAGAVDQGSFEFLDKELFTDVLAGESREADLVVKARLRDEDSWFLVHLEHQAQPQAEFGRRMFRYFARLHEKHGARVYPIAVFSHDSARAEPDEFTLGFPDLAVLRFRFRAIQLRRLNWRDYVARENPVASALMARMGMRPEDRPRVKLECLRLMTRLNLDRARLRLLSGFVDTYLRLSAAEALRFRQEADTLLTVEQRHEVMELTTSWKEEGRMDGQRELVRRLLARRCGALTAELTAEVNRLERHRLEALAEALLDFRTPADLERWLRGF